jgi:hypothetical protein
MKVTNEIREAFLFAVMNLDETKNGLLPQTIEKRTINRHITNAFAAIETEELMAWLTLQEKVKFGRKLLELTSGMVETAIRDLQSDLTEDR